MTSKTITFLLTDVIRLMRREYKKKSLSITVMQARALYTVSHFEGIRQVALAERLEIQPITLARLIDQLENDKLVERRVDVTDRRAYCLYVTDFAEETLKDIEIVTNEVREKALKGLSQAEIKQLKNLLERTHSNLLDDSASQVTLEEIKLAYHQHEESPQKNVLEKHCISASDVDSTQETTRESRMEVNVE